MASMKVWPEEESVPQFTEEYKEVHSEEIFKQETTTFRFHGEQFFSTYWRPNNGETKGAVFICHGYAEYVCPSYDELALQLVREGYLVFGHDHVGHGRSTGQRVQIDGMEDYVDPVLAHVKKAKLKDKPLFLIGHSMGGLIGVLCALKEPQLFKGMVLMGPLITMDPDLATPFKKKLAGFFQGILPSFAIGQLDASLITRDQEVVKRVDADELGWHGGFRAKHSYVLIQICDWLADEGQLEKLKLPLLIFQGGKDKLVNAQGAQILLDAAASDDKKLVKYEEAFHNLFVETDDVKIPVLKETIDWINGHLL